MADKIEKLYSISLTGEKEVLDGMGRVNKAFDDAKKKFLEMKKEMDGKLFIDIAEYDKAKRALSEAEKEMEKLRNANQQMRAEIESLTNAQNRQNSVNEGTAKSNKVLESSYKDVTARVKELQKEATNDNSWRTWSNSIEQNAKKLAELQLKLQATNASIKSSRSAIEMFAAMGDKGAKAMADATDELAKHIKAQAELKQEISQTNIEMRNQIKENQADKDSMDEMAQTLGLMRKMYRSLNAEGRESDAGTQLLDQIQKLDEALKLADASMGNYQRNVGNYTNSIIAAFHEAGLDNVITMQLEKANQKAADLDREFEQMKQKLAEINATGGSGFERIEAQMIQNRQQAGELRSEINRVNEQLAGIGNMGTQSVEALNRGFDSVKSRITSLVLGFVGLQAIMNKITAGISEGIKSAKEISGVEAAFNRLNNPHLLDDLRAATKGTVNDLELMKAAVNADNFGIPVKQMATFMEFAKQRADDTGQSVDYLVNSIVSGLGRKSTLVLDNLQITAEDIKKELGGVSVQAASVGKLSEAVGKIIERENAKIEKSADTVKTKLDQNQTSWENLRTELGGKVLPVLAEVNAILFSIVSFIVGIPFPFWIASLVALTAAYVAANSEMILSRMNAINDAIAKNQAAASTGLLATANKTLANSLKVVTTGFRTLFNVIKAHPITALVLIVVGLLIWLARIAAKNEELRKSFAQVSQVLEKIMGIFGTLFGTIASKLVPIIDKLVNMFLVPLIEKILPPLILQLRILAGTVNAVAGEFLNALKVGLEFARGFSDIWEGIKTGDVSKIKEALKKQGDALINGFKDTKERIRKNFLEGFMMDPADTDTTSETPKEDPDSPTDPKDKLKEILAEVDRERDRLLAIQKQRRLKDEIDEETYLKNIQRINENAINKKLSLIKGKNAEERKMIQELKAERLQNEKDTNDQIFELRKKEADRLLAEAQRQAKNQLDDATADPETTKLEKEQAEQEYYTTLLNLQLDYNNQMDELEKEFNQNSIENETERINAIEDLNRELAKNTYEITQAMYEESLDIIKRAKERAISDSTIETQSKRIQILQDQRLSSREREIELNRIYIQNQIDNISAEIEAQKKLILVYIQRYGLSAMIREETQKAMADLKQLEADLIQMQGNLANLGKTTIGAPSDQNTQDIIKNKLLDSFNLEEDDYGNMIGYALAQSFDIATQAMNNYFAAEEQRIQRSKELAFERIDLEKKQLLAQAQSQGEREAIELQAEQKKKQAEKAAGERLKKIKKQEAAIAYAMELANIWASVMQLGPIAGPIMGGILSGLATVRYAMNLNTISKTQFGKGGMFTRMFGGGGVLDGPSHAENNGMPVVNPRSGEIQAYLEGGEGIINKRSMRNQGIYSVTGTPAQIASRINRIGGGIDFMGGATMRRWYADGGYIGSNVQPPVFNSYYDRANSAISVQEQNERMNRVEDILSQTTQVLNREINRKTVVSIHDINDTQDETRKQSEIATL
ncbi:MAG: hypothetical protein WBA59_03925 [Moheibacter sp.]